PLPSPKSQLHAVTLPSDWSSKCTLSGTSPEGVSATKEATGGGSSTVTQAACVTLSAPVGLVTASVTEYTPGLAYACCGFFALELAPSPKSQLQASTFGLERSLNVTARGATPLGGARAKFALVAGTATLIKPARESVSLPPGPFTVSVTV